MRRPIPLLLVLLAGVAPADDGKPLESRVNVAIDRSAAFLVAKQDEDGSWRKDDKVHPLGRTALSTFALLHAGYPRDHPAVKKALAFLGISAGYALAKKPRSTYEAACLVLLLNALGREHGEQIKEICDWLVENFNDGQGLWGYPDGIPDLSNTQYAALALKAGARHGHRTPPRIWKRLVDTVIRLQADCGAMRYRGGTIYGATMTHAGLLVLLFAKEALGGKAPMKDIRPAMKKGHEWYADRYSVERNPHGRGWRKEQYYYYMYGLERYAVFFGFEKIAGHDWYREGAEELLSRQLKNGSWGNLEETCFAILFLRRASLTEPEERVVGKGEGKFEDPPARPRPEKDVPWLTEWLVAGPYLGTPREDDQLFEDYLDPKRISPRDGGKAGKKKWVLHRFTDEKVPGKVDFKQALDEKPWAAYHAAVWLHAEKETEAYLWLAADDSIQAWHRGKEVLFGDHKGYSGDDYYRVRLFLPKGRSLLLLKVTNLEYYAYFRARLSDLSGGPLSGVSATGSARR